MISGLLGRKLGMTQIFDKDGNLIPVTIVECGPCTVLELIETPLKIKLGYESVKEEKINKARAGFFKKINVKPTRRIKEFGSSDNSEYEIGQEIKADFFKAGDFVDISGISTGKGFQGGMKKHGWMGGPAGHGSNHKRRVGSIGACADPARVFKGRPMPGQMGNEKVTTQGIRVMEVDVEKNLLLVKGSVPGSKNTQLTICRSFKKAWKSLEEKKVVVAHKINPMKQSKAKAGKKG